MTTALLTAWVALSCVAADVREVCCPSACSAKQSKNWPRADAVLRACVAELGCADSNTYTVNLACECRH